MLRTHGKQDRTTLCPQGAKEKGKGTTVLNKFSKAAVNYPDRRHLPGLLYSWCIDTQPLLWLVRSGTHRAPSDEGNTSWTGRGLGTSTPGSLRFALCEGPSRPPTPHWGFTPCRKAPPTLFLPTLGLQWSSAARASGRSVLSFSRNYVTGGVSDVPSLGPWFLHWKEEEGAPCALGDPSWPPSTSRGFTCSVFCELHNYSTQH